MKTLSLITAVALATAVVIPVRADFDDDTPYKAGHGDQEALHDFFQQSLHVRPGASANYEHQLREVFISVGNSHFASALSREQQSVRSRVLFFLNEAMGSH